jgi:uncharacterized protein (UPF0332 family)
MKDYTRKLLDKAVDTIESAEILLDHGKMDGAAGRAYYALFYVAEALLNEKGFITASMAMLLAHMDGNLPRQNCSTKNSIAG